MKRTYRIWPIVARPPDSFIYQEMRCIFPSPRLTSPTFVSAKDIYHPHPLFISCFNGSVQSGSLSHLHSTDGPGGTGRDRSGRAHGHHFPGNTPATTFFITFRCRETAGTPLQPSFAENSEVTFSVGKIRKGLTTPQHTCLGAFPSLHASTGNTWNKVISQVSYCLLRDGSSGVCSVTAVNEHGSY